MENLELKEELEKLILEYEFYQKIYTKDFNETNFNLAASAAAKLANCVLKNQENILNALK